MDAVAHRGRTEDSGALLRRPARTSAVEVVLGTGSDQPDGSVGASPEFSGEELVGRNSPMGSHVRAQGAMRAQVERSHSETSCPSCSDSAVQTGCPRVEAEGTPPSSLRCGGSSNHSVRQNDGVLSAGAWSACSAARRSPGAQPGYKPGVGLSSAGSTRPRTLR